MNLVCTHCDRYDVAPLQAVPPDWRDVQPGDDAVTGVTLKMTCGNTADHFGICPACVARRKMAHVVPASEPEASLFGD